ncbi:hypothetical protein PQR05_29275 [Paraburkholderia sediminicola]|uniref:hypothetical protein n=1 Tax=Paraburkholderia sediminicola TaxID=458836 RepID=UPI0038B9CCB1
MLPVKVEKPEVVAYETIHQSATLKGHVEIAALSRGPQCDLSTPLTYLIPAFQSRVAPWMMLCFGAEISADTEERNHRFFEESAELVQACGMKREHAHALVDYVFDRAVGERTQEVGGVMVTLAALCLAQDIDMQDSGETELARIWTMVDAIRAKQAAKPRGSALPVRLPFREAVERMVAMLEENEWAEHVATITGRGDPLAVRLESEITRLHNDARREGSLAAEYLRRALEWIDAIPADVVAALPAMPGFDRDEAEQAIAECEPNPIHAHTHMESGHGSTL